MVTQQNVTQQDGAGAAAAQAAQRGDAAQSAQRSESALRPPVDIFETAEGITLIADMPGVSREHLNLQVEGNTLILEGTLQFDMVENMEALYADVRSTLYRCSFVLSPELETSRIEAILKDGVLAVRIPKKAEARPRRIEVRA
ncbi:MAG TPA: Hsp20/alpha crystallin family protein [Steroidobacteraceae bacterium]|jgi:HSP20 family protein|nr:Hsp20/alpha crystallin family protein [Steroidobacteraceae bacterium]